MPDQYRKISELPRVTQVADSDLFIVETGNGTKATTVQTFKQSTITKEDIGLGNVDNTSDATKNAATVVLTNKTIDGDNNIVKVKRGLDVNIIASTPTEGVLKYSTDTQKVYIGTGNANLQVGGNPNDFPISSATQTALNAKAAITEVQTWLGAKQDTLVSGTNIKTINNSSIVGQGNLDVSSTWGGITGTLSSQTDLQNALDAKQATLISGSNIKTINNNSLVGSGNINVDSLPTQTGQNGKFLTTDGTDASWATVDLSSKQDTLVSGTNIKTVNNSSILGSGNLQIDALPSQATHAGKFLTTDGSSASWATVTVPTKISDLTDDTATNPIDKADTLTDLTATVTELNYVDGVTSAIQTQLDAKQTTANLVTTITSSSTDAQYPSAKCVYDLIGNLETVLSQI